MTRRPALIAAAALAVFGLTTFVQTADAITAKTRQCVRDARQRLRQRTTEARVEARDKFSDEFTSCFGPGADCASACMTAQAVCQEPFNTAAATARGNCAAKFQEDLDKCRLPGELDPQQCASAARLVQFACNQEAAADAAPGIQGCNDEFGQCTAACASAR